MHNRTGILSGPILPALLTFAIPLLLSLFLQALYGAVDMWMVGQYATTADVSAVTTGSQTMQIINSMIIGLSVGITITLGNAIGERNPIKCANTIGSGAALFMGLAAVLTLGIVSLASPLSSLLNAPANAFADTVSYIRICGAGIIFIVGFNVINGIFTGIGDAKTPFWFVLIAALVNIVGDYLLVAVFDYGASGAALATVLAQTVAVLSALTVLKKRLPFALDTAALKPKRELIRRIVTLGFPMSLQNTCNEISYLAVIGFVNALGVSASSAVGIAEKLVMFILLIPLAFMLSISTFTAQNMGARQPKRAHRTLGIAMLCSGLFGSIMAWLSYFHGNMLASFFINNEKVIVDAANFLQATAIECLILSVALCFTGYFTGIGKTKFILCQGLIAIFCVRIPFAYFASHAENPTLFNIGLALVWAALTILVLSTLYYSFLRWREKVKALHES